MLILGVQGRISEKLLSELSLKRWRNKKKWHPSHPRNHELTWAPRTANHVPVWFVTDDSQTVGQHDLQLRDLLLYSGKPNFSPGKCLLLGAWADLFLGWEVVADMMDGPSKIHFLLSLFLTELTFWLGIQALLQGHVLQRRPTPAPGPAAGRVLIGLSNLGGFKLGTTTQSWLMGCDRKSTRGLLEKVSSLFKDTWIPVVPFPVSRCYFGIDTWDSCGPPETRRRTNLGTKSRCWGQKNKRRTESPWGFSDVMEPHTNRLQSYFSFWHLFMGGNTN